MYYCSSEAQYSVRTWLLGFTYPANLNVTVDTNHPAAAVTNTTPSHDCGMQGSH